MKESREPLLSMSTDRSCGINEEIQNTRKVLFNDVKVDQLTAYLKFNFTWLPLL